MIAEMAKATTVMTVRGTWSTLVSGHRRILMKIHRIHYWGRQSTVALRLSNVSRTSLDERL
jgi:hypothetical protein